MHCLITGQQRHWEGIRSNHGMVTYWIQTRVAQLTPYITTPVSVLKIPMETIRLCSSQGVLAWLLFVRLRCTVMKSCVGSPKVPHGTLELDPLVDSLALVALTVHKESRITQGNSFYCEWNPLVVSNPMKTHITQRNDVSRYASMLPKTLNHTNMHEL